MQRSPQHSTYSALHAKLFQNVISKSVHRFGTTAVIIRAKLFPWKLLVVDRKEMEGWFDRESEDEARPRGGELFND